MTLQGANGSVGWQMEVGVSLKVVKSMHRRAINGHSWWVFHFLFVFVCFETGSCYVSQSGLELLGSMIL